MSVGPGVRVSVVVAAYNSPPELDGLVASLDAQSFSADEYEAIFVDDGSSDDTLERLRAIAAQRAYMQVQTISNSGWPGRPRNVGTAEARGEYIFYADHDDYLFPEALERMVHFADAHELDVVHPKEVVEGWSGPGWTTWQSEESRIINWTPAALDCITPHKLYRKTFLENHGIHFPEGKVRVEDFSFNAQAWSATDAVGIFSSYPCYRWTIYDDNSHKKAYDFESYWSDFVASLQPLLDMSAGAKKNQLLLRWYRSRILERVAGIYSTFNEKYRKQLNGKFSELLEYFPEELDGLLTTADRHRSYLLRRGEFDALLALSQRDLGLKLRLNTTEATWTRGVLSIRARGLLVDAGGEPVRFVERPGGALNRELPEAIAAGIPESVLDIQKDLRLATPQVLIRGRSESVDWYVPSTSQVSTVDFDGAKAVAFEFTATVDPQVAAFGAPLTDEIWDVFARLPELGYTATHRLGAPAVSSVAALLHGRQAIAYRTKPGFLALDLGSNARTVAGTAQPKSSDVSFRGQDTIVALERVHVAGHTSIVGTVESAGVEKGAILESTNRGAVLRIEGRHDMKEGARAVFNGRRSALLLAAPSRISSTRSVDHAKGSTSKSGGRDQHAHFDATGSKFVKLRHGLLHIIGVWKQKTLRLFAGRQ